MDYGLEFDSRNVWFTSHDPKLFNNESIKCESWFVKDKLVISNNATTEFKNENFIVAAIHVGKEQVKNETVLCVSFDGRKLFIQFQWCEGKEVSYMYDFEWC
jgi:hypothetical protein